MKNMDTQQHGTSINAQGKAAPFSYLTSSQTARDYDQVVETCHGVAPPPTEQSPRHTTLLYSSSNRLNHDQDSGQAAPVARICPPDTFVHGRDANGVRQLAFNDVNDAKDWLHMSLPPLLPNDPTIDLVDVCRARCVRILVDAVYDLRQCNDGQKMQNHFIPRRKSYFHNLEVEAACHVLFGNLMDFCRHGFRGLRKFNLLMKKNCSEEDMTANCSDRFNNIITALPTWKSICKGMIEENTKKWQLVNAPLSMVGKKKVEKGGNKLKKNTTDELKAIKKEVIAAETSQLTSHLAAPTRFHLDVSDVAESSHQYAPVPNQF
jgi:hypothetical protein